MHVLKYKCSSFILSSLHIPTQFGAMKWVTVCSCLLLVSFAESKNVPTRYQDVEVPMRQPRIEILKDMDMETFFLSIFSQFLQQATFDEVHKLVEDAATFSNKCFAEGFADSGCNDTLFSFFPDKLCSAKDLPEKYGYADCCSKVGSERNECLISHKNATSGFIPPYQNPDAHELCTQFQGNPKLTVHRFLYERARRDPTNFVQSFFVVTDVYKKLLTKCCQAAEKELCFKEKVHFKSKRELESPIEPKATCYIVKKFGTGAVETVEHILLSQQFPQANVSTVFGLAKLLAVGQRDCCRGDSVRCFSIERDAADFLCSHHDTISSKLKENCEKEGFERNPLGFAENDDKPSDLPPTAREFIEDHKVCQLYAENQVAHLGKFRYENGRRHPELPQYLLLRHAEGYENLLKNCCAMEHPEQCLLQGEGQLEKEIAETLEVFKMTCEIYDMLGDDLFQNFLLVTFVKNIPQLSFEEMYQYTKEMTKYPGECCHWNDTKKLACYEGKVETTLGKICSRHQQKPINAQVDKCCNGPFPFWIKCFAGPGESANYTHDAFEPSFHSNLCLLDSENTEKRKKMLIVDLVKNNPDFRKEQLDPIIKEFEALLTKCCRTEKEDECFKEEGEKLTDQIKAISRRH